MNCKKLIFSTIIGLCVIQSFSSQAQESKFKALFIYKFAEYIEWPTNKQNIIVGVTGESDVLKELTHFATIKGNMTVMKIEDPSEATQCDIVFLTKDAYNQINTFNTVIAGKSILVVSEDSKITGTGSDIGFFMDSGKLQFLISEKSIRDKKMTPSSKLLALGNTI